MTVRVTGAGLIGTALAQLLTERGDKVVLVDVQEPSGVPSEVEFIRADITMHRRLIRS